MSKQNNESSLEKVTKNSNKGDFNSYSNNSKAINYKSSSPSLVPLESKEKQKIKENKRIKNNQLKQAKMKKPKIQENIIDNSNFDVNTRSSLNSFELRSPKSANTNFQHLIDKNNLTNNNENNILVNDAAVSNPIASNNFYNQYFLKQNQSNHDRLLNINPSQTYTGSINMANYNTQQK
jgi:hypothetical protein